MNLIRRNRREGGGEEGVSKGTGTRGKWGTTNIEVCGQPGKMSAPEWGLEREKP